ncbi:MAG: hypothetical protein U9N61_07285, partial [Euryarchaeota archaeon]|nr:hypothetical protein [Euryarchaeota archaeon]
CDLLEIDAHDHFDLEFSTVAELVERLKVADYERLKSFFHALAADLARKNGADVYVFDNSGDTVGSFIRCP